ncbi:hypothetical protein QBC35DRAFT_502057 [Podospora australis]|uniref:Defect at low temperature protein 1 n=1 Tax=Podospora australis TaxID=1536484 RepID=A0AAN6WRH3_9PEZI|nr:hypothetical protein QBC35DRAFT_502057 [Podospora australis]
MSAASLLFVIIYNFFYYLLYLVLLAFLIVSPVDLIQQAVQKGQNWNILVIAVCYVVTILVIAFIYASRLFINRSVLSSIPKTWIPIDKGDVPRSVREMIVEGLSRSAAIAYEARPRVPLAVNNAQSSVAGGNKEEEQTRSGWKSMFRKSGTAVDGVAVVGVNVIPQHKPVWGEIEHPGWGSPLSPDLPNLQYETVITELPNLIEAKALTLAPPDPESRADPPTLDPDAVVLLQRPEYMGLREYLTHLTDLAVLAPLATTTEFLSKYEAARFSGRPLSNEQFRHLMHLFAEILRNMHPLNPAVLLHHGEDDGSSGRPPTFESDIDNDAPRGTSPSSEGTPVDGLGGGGLQIIIPSSSTGPGQGRVGGTDLDLERRGTSSTTSSGRRYLRPGLGSGMVRNSSANTWLYQTAPTTPKSRHTGISRASSSADSFAQTRKAYYPASQTSSSASEHASIRSGGSAGSGGSVIRLAGHEDMTDLPYVLTYTP